MTLEELQEKHTPGTVIAGVVGNVMEWYDFALYGYFAPIISQHFFPSENQISSLLATYGVFAAGFLMRPLGAMLFGYVGDRFSRSRVLIMSIILMALPTFLLGCLPTDSQIGVWAAVLLVVIRLIQGLSVGGEFSGSVTYVVETAPRDQRGLSGSWANFGSMVGMLLGAGIAAAVTTWLPQDAVQSWGWRMPFWIGGIFGIIAFILVKGLPDTAKFAHHESSHRNDSPLHEALTKNRRQTILAVLFASGYGVFFYIPLVYLPTYVSSMTGMPLDRALQINTIGTALLLVLIPVSGIISDHLMRRRTFLLVGFVSTVVLAWFGFRLLHAGGFGDVLAAQLMFSMLIAIPLGGAPAMLVELFPTEDRLTGYSVAYNIGLGVAGGSAPMIATWLIDVTGNEFAPAWYLVAMAGMSAAALWFMRDRSREALL